MHTDQPPEIGTETAFGFPISWLWWMSGELLTRIIWVNYNDLTATSLEIMINKGNHPQMALCQVSEIL